MAKRVFILGGTGFMGRVLVAALLGRDARVTVLTRNGTGARAKLGEAVGRAGGEAIEFVEGDPNLAGDWQARLSGCDAVINLAGQSVAGQRWSARYKQMIHDSRVETTRYLVEGLAALDADQRPSLLVSASGIDYYPFDVDLGAALPVDEDDDVDESAPSGSTFLARVCRNWEAEAEAAKKLDMRVVLMRTGVVLGASEGGPLDKIVTPFRLFAGGRIGRGRQWFSWIHLADAVDAYLFALDRSELAGPVNLVAPNPVRAGEFARALGKAMGRPAWLPVPEFALKAAVGEFAEYLVHGRRAVPAALLRCGFEFSFATLDRALEDIFAR
ncbi:MAG: TIGR01777 family oxidoreductase [Proteobacteria bacterium]|nr:TIGR01777 family oxidoreductase [Pseudomonadota bacterium]